MAPPDRPADAGLAAEAGHSAEPDQPHDAAPRPPDAESAALAAAIRRLSRASVLVVGDAMLDRYVYGEVERVSPEAPVPVLAVQRELAMPGGAGNVVRNLGALDVAVAFVSVVGDDQAGSDLTGLIGGQPGVEPWLLVQGSRATTVKTRMVAQGQQLLRVDREDTNPIHPKLAERMLRIARDAMAATSLTILSDYRKGVMSGDMPEKLVAAARQAGRPVLVDLRGGDFAPYAGADVVLPSRRDLGRATGLPVEDDAGIAAAAAQLRAAHGFGAVLVGRGEDGMTLANEAGALHFRHRAVEAFDVSGANDTSVATLGAALAAGVALPLAARLANLAAGVVMGRTGTAVVREQDLLAALSPEEGPGRKIVGRDTLALQVESWRRRGLRTGLTYGCFDALRPGHLHMLQQARAACDRLVVAITGDVSAPRRRDGRPAQPEATRAMRLAALSDVDAVVIADADGPLPLLHLLRPDVLVAGADRNGVDAAVVGEWGGRVVLAARLPEPA